MKFSVGKVTLISKDSTRLADSESGMVRSSNGENPESILSWATFSPFYKYSLPTSLSDLTNFNYEIKLWGCEETTNFHQPKPQECSR